MTSEYVTTARFEKAIGEVKELLEEINARLYKDNGGLSIQTRLDRNSRIINAIIWFLGVVLTATVTVLIGYSIVRGAG